MKMRRIIPFCLALLMLLATLPLTAVAAQGTAVVVGYSVTDASGKAVSSIRKGSVVTIKVSVKDTHTTLEQIGGAENLDVTRLVDSFSGGSVSVSVTSGDTDMLTYDVTISDASYSGAGKALRFMAGYKGGDSFSTMELSLSEAIEYEEPKPEEPKHEPPKVPDASPQPMVLVSIEEQIAPISPGEERSITIRFQNLDGVKLSSPVASFTPSESLMLTGGATSFKVDDIPAKGSKSVTVKVRATDSVSAAAQSLGVELKFNYYNNVSTTQGSVSDRVTIPAVVKSADKHPQPPVIVTRSALSPVKAGQVFDLTLTIKNAGETAMENTVATIGTSDELILQNDASTILLGVIGPGDSETISLHVKASNALTSSTQNVNLDLKYAYDSGGELVQATTTDRVSITTLSEKHSQPPVIITRNTLQPISAGQVFDLTLNIKNAGTVLMKNPVATVTTSDGLILQNDASTILLGEIDADRSAAVTLKIQAVKELTSSTQSVSLDLRFAYESGGELVQATVSERVNLAANVTGSVQLESAVPNVVIGSYEYGGSSVSAGGRFPLSFTLRNTGKLPIENIVVTVDGGDSFTMDGSTNTFYYERIASGGEKQQPVNMQTLASAKTGAQSIAINCRYVTR